MLKGAIELLFNHVVTLVQAEAILLDISRLVRGTLTLHLAPVNLATVIEAALDVVRPQAQAKQIEIVTDLMLPPQIFERFR